MTQPVRQDETLERSVLGGAIVLDLALAFVGKLRAGDFADPRHGAVWDAAIEAGRLGRVSIDAVCSSLRASRRLNAVGGRPFVASLLPFAPSDTTDFARLVADLAGAAMVRRTHAAAARIVSLAGDEAIAPPVFARRALEEIGAAAVDTSARGAVPIDEVILSEDIERARRAEERRTRGTSGLRTGLTALDALIYRLRPAQNIVLAGRPGSAKTSLALRIARSVAGQGERVLFWSLEMPQADLVRRLQCAEAGVLLSSAIADDFSEEEYERFVRASQELSLLRDRLAFFDQPSTFDDIVAGTLREHQRSPLGLVVIDHLQHVQWGKRREEREHISACAKEAKELAKTLRVPVLLLSQLNRKVESREDKRPMLADLHGSGDIEAAADVVIGLYRDEYYHRDSADKGTAELIVLKQRDGATDTARVAFDAAFTRFRDLDNEWNDEGTVE